MNSTFLPSFCAVAKSFLIELNHTFFLLYICGIFSFQAPVFILFFLNHLFYTVQVIIYERYIGMEDSYSLWLYGTYSLIGEKHQIMNDETNYLVKISIIAITRITYCFERGP